MKDPKRTIEIKNEVFEVLLTENEIKGRLQDIAQVIRKDMEDQEPVFLCILKGSLFVAADLIRAYGQPCYLEAIRAHSYQGKQSKGVVDLTMTDNVDLRGKTVIIIEDIVETGRTLHAVYHHLRHSSAERVLTFCLLRKPSAAKLPFDIDYVGFDIDQSFVIGYGLDYDEAYRQLPDIYQLKD